MEQVQLLIPAVRGVLHRKLEDLILDAMDHRGRIPQNIFELEQIAQENGFSDIQTGIDELLKEFARKQVEEQLLARRRKTQIFREEKEVQEYLIRDSGENLSILEEGLKYAGHEVVKRGGLRLDISAKGRDEEEVIVELKARPYSWHKVHAQLMAYYNENETKDKRLIFASSVGVHPLLMLALREHIEQGRMKFVDITRSGDGYIGKVVNLQDINVPQNLDWGSIFADQDDNVADDWIDVVKAPKPQFNRRINGREDRRQDSGLARVATGVSLNDNKGESTFEGTEEIPSGEFERKKWGDYSYLDKVSAIVTVLSNRDPNLEKIEGMQIESHNYNQLESLKDNSQFENIPAPDQELVNKAFTGISGHPKQANIVSKAYKLVDNFKSRLKESAHAYLDLLSFDIRDNSLKDGRHNIEERLENLVSLETAYRGLFNEVYRSKKFNDLVRELNLSRKELPEDDPLRKNLEILYTGFNKPTADKILDFMRKKIERVKSLNLVNQDLAKTYLSHSLWIEHFAEGEDSALIGEMIMQSDNEKARSHMNKSFAGENLRSSVNRFIERDNRLYNEIVALFEQSAEVASNEGRKELKSAANLRVTEGVNNYFIINDTKAIEFRRGVDPVFVYEGRKQQVSSSQLSYLNRLGEVNITEPPVHPDSEIPIITRRISQEVFNDNPDRKRKIIPLVLKALDYSEANTLFRDSYREIELTVEEVLAMMVRGESEGLSNQDIRQAINELREVRRSDRDLRLWHHSREHASLDKLLREAKKERAELGRSSKQIDDYLNLLSGVEWDVEIVGRYLETKMDRLEALSKISTGVTSAYLAHTMRIAESFDQLDEVSTQKTGAYYRRLKWYIEQDNKLYHELIKIFEPIPQEPPTSPLEQTAASVTTSPATATTTTSPAANGNGHGGNGNGNRYRPVPIAPRVYTPKDLTGGQKLRHPTDTIRATTQSFVDGVLNNPQYDAQTRERLASNLARSEWYSRGLDDTQTTTFFAQLGTYAQRGQVPSKREIELLADHQKTKKK